MLQDFKTVIQHTDAVYNLNAFSIPQHPSEAPIHGYGGHSTDNIHPLNNLQLFGPLKCVASHPSRLVLPETLITIDIPINN